MRKAKIVCTIGPASRDPDVLKNLVRAGMDVARLNFSHGTKDEHRQVLGLIRSISRDLGKPVAVLQDLPGPKLRIGPIAGGEVHLAKGDPFALTTKEVEGDIGRVSVNFPPLIKGVRIGDIILLADGNIQLEVVAKKPQEIDCRVVIGGALSSGKGVNLPEDVLSVPVFTRQDEEALLWGIEHEVDFIALSFIRRAEDLHQAKKLLDKKGSPIRLIAKIEKARAIENLGAIVDMADGIMIARGDLGVEIALERVPIIQKELIKKVNSVGKPVITATQMLRSMVGNTRPTRAEAADVANAILDGSDALMLSEETAVGKYPVETVRVMSNIIREAEKSFSYWRDLTRRSDFSSLSIEESVGRACTDMAYYLQAQAIITPTESGRTARLVSKYRPKAPILAITRHTSTQRQLQLSWGVFPLAVAEFIDMDNMIMQAKELAVSSGWMCVDDIVVFTAGLPLMEPGNTNLIKADRI